MQNLGSGGTVNEEVSKRSYRFTWYADILELTKEQAAHFAADDANFIVDFLLKRNRR